MRSTPVTGAPVARRPFEFCLRFHRPLRRAEAVEADTGSTVAHISPPPARPEPEPLPKHTPAPQPPTQISPPAPQPPTDFGPLESEWAVDVTRLESAFKDVTTAIAGLRQDHEGRLREWQRAAVELASTIASRILHERVASGDFPIDAKVRDMIAQLGEDVPVVVRLNPLDLDLLKARLEGADESPLAGPDAPRFVADSALNRGECQVEGRESMLLSNVSRELQEIRDDLLRSMDNARS